MVRDALIRIEGRAARTGQFYTVGKIPVSSKMDVLEELLRSEQAESIPPKRRPKWADTTFDRGMTWWGERKRSALEDRTRGLLGFEVQAGRMAAITAERMSHPGVRTPDHATLLRYAEAEGGGYTSADLEFPGARPGQVAILVVLRGRLDELRTALEGLPPARDDPENKLEVHYPVDWSHLRRAAALGVQAGLVDIERLMGELREELERGLFEKAGIAEKGMTLARRVRPARRVPYGRKRAAVDGFKPEE